MRRTIDDYFRDWFHEPFGYGYGSGEESILKSLKNMTNILKDNIDSGGNYTYDYRDLEKLLGEEVTWLLINALCKNDDIEYGSSPRFGWFYGSSARLIEYIKEHSVDDMYETVCGYDVSTDMCFGQYCSCGEKQVNKRCPNNPFWNDNI